MFRTLFLSGGVAAALTMLLTFSADRYQAADLSAQNLVGGDSMMDGPIELPCHGRKVTGKCDLKVWDADKQKEEQCPGWSFYTIDSTKVGNYYSFGPAYCVAPCNNICGLYSDKYNDCDGVIHPIPKPKDDDLVLE